MTTLLTSKNALVLALVVVLMAGLDSHAQTSGVLREVYSNYTDGSLAGLPNFPAYPNNPSSESLLTTAFEAPKDVAESYVQRCRALLIAPATGLYTFWIASDDDSFLYLSTDETPANKLEIASVPQWTASREWTKFASQTSPQVSLLAGKRYYIEAVMREGGGGDNLAVGWQLPSGVQERPIPASRLLVYGLGAPVVTQQPANVTVLEGGMATFTVKVERSTGMTFQWQKNNVTIPGATSFTYTFGPATLADSGLDFRCLLTNGFGTTNSLLARLTVQADTVPPTLTQAGTLGANSPVYVVFSEPVEATSATNRLNYSLNNGVTLTSAVLGSDNRTVYLSTSPLNSGVTYTVTVSNVKDRATTPNTLLAGSTRSFQFRTVPLDPVVLTGTNEPAGPSSRRSSLVLSEIMYHPLDRKDGKNLEFIEIYNAQAWPEEISGFRVRGEINYTFPSNTFIGARSYLVIAPSPADITAVYSIANVFGGFTNNLSNGSGTLTLQNHLGAVLQEVSYSGQAPFPPAADGLGHSLVLARPSYGENDPAAWSPSAFVGGSPGKAEPEANTTFRSVRINEILAHTDDPVLDYVELFNYSTNQVNIGGLVISDNGSTNMFVIPANTQIGPMGFYVVNQNQLQFSLSAAGETVFLKNSVQNYMIDAVTFEAQENGVAYGRTPDGAPTFDRLRAQTPGTNNASALLPAIVINEIHYDPLSGDSNEEFVELYNPGTNSVSLAGWRLEDAVTYSFPKTAILPAKGYGVVGSSVERLLTNYPSLKATQAFGNFKGTLKNGGERLLLTKSDTLVVTNGTVVSTNTLHIVEDEVSYGTGGRWAPLAHGEGSSLELVDARADNRLAANWAESDETRKAPWTTVEWTGLVEQGGGSSPDALQIQLMGAGECLVDTVEVISGAANLVANGTFESGTTGWLLQGTHSGSSLETSEGYNSSQSLHLRASGRGDTGANRLQAALSAVPATGSSVTLRARVRWLKGNPEILLRLRGNWLEASGRMVVPATAGTPGAVNSRARVNTGPAILEVTHLPVLPTASQTVTIRARVSDPDGVANLFVSYRLDPSTNLLRVDMVSHGAGYFSATLPGQASGIMAAFTLTAVDGAAGTPGMSTFPNDAPVRECLIRWGEIQLTSNLGDYHLWVSQTNINRWTTRERNSNEPLDATFVYGNSRVVYNMTTLYSGSPWHTPGYNGPLGNRCDYVLHFNDDDLLLGSSDFVMATAGNLDNDNTLQTEQTSFWIGYQLGTPFNYRRYASLQLNGQQRASIFEDSQQPNGDLVSQWFPNDSNGDLFKVEDWFEFDDSGDIQRSNRDATLQNFLSSNGTKNQALYRWNWRKRAVQQSSHDYSTLYDLVNALANTDPATFVRRLDQLVDVKEWSRVIAMEHIVGNWDSYGFNRGKNMYAYKPQQGRWVLLPWDIDFTLSNGGDPFNSPILPTEISIGDPALHTLFNSPTFARLYLQALEDAVNGPLQASRFNRLLDDKFIGLSTSGMGVASPDPIKNYLNGRRDHILSRLSTVNGAFALTSNGGANFSTTQSLLTLTGTAPFGVRSFKVNGVEFPVTWSSTTAWSMKLALVPGNNLLLVQGFDARGNLVSGAAKSITVSYTGSVDAAEKSIVINEIHFNPALPNTGFVELFNRSTTTAFDLSNWRLEGADFTFPAGTILPAGGYLLAVSDLETFNARYGLNLPVAGQISGKLSNSGETLRLIKPGVAPTPEVTISRVNYEGDSPWPVAPDGSGASLQLMDPAQGSERIGNWMAQSAWKFVSVTGTPTNNTLHLYLAAAGQVFLDELALVSGSTPATGSNLVQNGAFELPLASNWLVAANFSGSVVTNVTRHNGKTSLRLVSTVAGSASTSASIYQPNLPIVPGQTYTLSFWYLPDTNAGSLTVKLGGTGLASTQSILASGTLTLATPGTLNSLAGVQPAIPTLWINEVQPNNVSGSTDSAGQRDPWLELYNAGSTAIDLSSYYLGNSPLHPMSWRFASGTSLNPGQFLLVWLDGDLSQNSPTEPHAGFRLDPFAGSLVLSRLQAQVNQVIDYIDYDQPGAGRSFGDYPDGQSFARQVFSFATPAAQNNPTSAPIAVVINEWMASNSSLLETNRNRFEDWIELFNASDRAVDLTGYTLTDTVTNATQWAFPAGTRIEARGRLFVWADGQNALNSTNSPDLHANFKLDKDGDEIALFSPDKALVDRVVFGLQTNDVSMGRFPDGAQKIAYMINPTPRSANVLPGSNVAPVLALIADQEITLGRTLQLTAQASDADLPAQTLTYSLEAGAPAGASIHPATGLLTWKAAANTVPGDYLVTVRVTDDGLPPAGDSRQFRVRVWAPPQFQAIQNLQNGRVSLSWSTQANKTYLLQYTDSLATTHWINLGDPRTGNGQTTTLQDASLNAAQRFYRLLQLD